MNVLKWSLSSVICWNFVLHEDQSIVFQQGSESCIFEVINIRTSWCGPSLEEDIVCDVCYQRSKCLSIEVDYHLLRSRNYERHGVCLRSGLLGDDKGYCGQCSGGLVRDLEAEISLTLYTHAELCSLQCLACDSSKITLHIKSYWVWESRSWLEGRAILS